MNKRMKEKSTLMYLRDVVLNLHMLFLSKTLNKDAKLCPVDQYRAGVFPEKLSVKHYLISLSFILFMTSSAYSQSEKPIISEFMAINDKVLADEDGDYSDWIEIFNPSDEIISLNGWHLTDNPSNLVKWQFPDISLNPWSYLIVFASDKDKTNISGSLHTNFKLSGSGEFLALVEPDGVTLSTSFADAYPVQVADVSYGLYGGSYVNMTNPTPGAENIPGDHIWQPDFSHKRGFYDAPFTVVLSSANTNSDIYYTTDGSMPTADSATKYESSLNIDKTTVLSAVAIDKTSLATSDVVTHTYLFVDSIMTQPNNPNGYPLVWGQDYPADYEMDPELCTPSDKEEIEAALKSLPTVSLVTNISHLFSHEDNDTTGGLYIFTARATELWERPVSMEYFDTAQSKSFQVNCGLRLHGGNSRKPYNSPKHSFRVSFRSKYGPSKLNFNMFEEKSAENEFNALVLRSGYNYSWIKNAPEQCEGADYIRDPFTKKTQLDMDRTAAHSKFVHLYINGLYWGVYNMSEKITNDFTQSYLGGDEDDYDVVKDHFGVVDGDRVAWDSLMATTDEGFETIEKYQKVQGNNADGTVNPSYLKLLDVRNFVDYMLINFYIGNIDWDRNNWIAARNRVTNEHGFKFFSWDAETSMNDLNENRVDMNNPGNPTGIYSKLRENEEFRLYFADRVHKHFFNGGALTSTETAKRYMDIANAIDKSMTVESARWGDYRRDVDPGEKTYELYTREEHWLERVNHMQSNYLPRRSEVVLDQLKEAGMYPDIEAPVFSHFGGEFPDPIVLSMSAGTDTIYYTTDNSDPREIGGAVYTGRAIHYLNPINLNEDLVIKARAKNGDSWSALTKAKFKFDHDFTEPVLISPINKADVNSENNLTFVWERTDDNVLLTYELCLYNEHNRYVYDVSNTTSFVVEAKDLSQNSSYSWKVTASDGRTRVASSENSFTTDNVVPEEFSIVSPIDFDTRDAKKDIGLIWSASKDDDNIIYKVLIIGEELTKEFYTQDTTYVLPGNTLRSGSLYKFQVEASDGKATTKTSEIVIQTQSDPVDGTELIESIAYVETYPNPVTDNLNIKIHVKEPLAFTIELRDITGRMLQSIDLGIVNGPYVLPFNMEAYKEGVYYLVIRSGDKNREIIKTEKIIKR